MKNTMQRYGFFSNLQAQYVKKISKSHYLYAKTKMRVLYAHFCFIKFAISRDFANLSVCIIQHTAPIPLNTLPRDDKCSRDDRPAESIGAKYALYVPTSLQQ